MDNMRVEVGVEESSKKKLMRSTWAGHVDKWEMKKWQRDQMPRKRRENGGEEDLSILPPLSSWRQTDMPWYQRCLMGQNKYPTRRNARSPLAARADSNDINHSFHFATQTQYVDNAQM